MTKSCGNTLKERCILRHPGPVLWAEWQAREDMEPEEMVLFPPVRLRPVC